MNAFVDEAIKQIALEGRKGCSLNRFWTLLEEELPINGCHRIGKELKVLVWNSLVNMHSSDFGIYIPKQYARELNVISEMHEEEEDERGATKVRLPMEHKKAKDLAFLEDVLPTLIAVDQCRFHFLGVRDAVTSRFKLSEKQIETLEEIGKSRRRGCLQSDLARTVNIAHKNFFFVIKQLEGRQLAVRNPVILNRGHENDTHVSATNIIHLPMFAPDVKLTQFQAFKMIADSEGEAGDDEGEESAYRMRDDASWMRQVSEKISQAKDRIVLEYDVKQSLGFRHTKGHRMWRRLKKKMVDLHLIKSFVASVEGKASVCLELIQEDFDKWLEAQRQQEWEEALKGPESSILMDQSLNRQLFQMIVDAGPQGLSTKELFGKLRLNSKRNMHRLRAMESLFGIQIRAESCGRSSVNRCFAPVAVLQKQMEQKEQEKVFNLPTVAAPAGGWMMAVKRAALIGDEFAQDWQDCVESLSSEQKELTPPVPTAEDNVQQAFRMYLSTNLVSSKADFRFHHLCEKIQLDGFILRSHVKAYLCDLEVTHGLSTIGKGPDRKTIDRVVDRLVHEKKIKKMKVSMLTKSGGEPKMVDVLVKFDLQVTEEVLRHIRQANEVFATTCRQRSLLNVQSELQQARGETLPVLNDLTRLPRPALLKQHPQGMTEQGLAFQQIHKNGFINAKMTRAKLLHYHICRLVGLGGFAPTEGSSCAAGARFPRLLGKSSRASSFRDPTSMQSKTYHFARHSGGCKKEETAAGNETMEQVLCSQWDYAFTPRQLWDSFPVDLYLQVVGTSKESKEIDSLSHLDQRMDQIPQEKLELLVDRLSRNRLADLLDLLCRLQLIEGSIAANASGAGLLESSRFIAHDTGIIEEPDGEDASNPTGRRYVRCALDTAEGLETYWLRLEFMFSQQRQLMESYFPAAVASEVCVIGNWFSPKTMTTSKWLTIQELMDDMEPLDWQKCREISKKMNVAFQQVVRLNRDRGRKKVFKVAKEPKEMKKRRKRARWAAHPAKKQKPKKQRKLPKKKEDVFSGVESEPATNRKTDLELLRKSREEKLRTGYWYRGEDIDLLSGYYAWLTSSKPTKSGARWTAMVGLPGGSSTAALHRCKRRLRYLQKQAHLKDMFESLEDVTARVYQQRWNRVVGSRDPNCRVVHEEPVAQTTAKRKRKTDSDLPEEIDDEEETEKTEVVGMEIFHLNPFIVMTQFKGMNILDVILQTCAEEDRELILKMKEIILEIAEKGPRMFKKETERPSDASPACRSRPLPEFVDLNSSVVSVEKRTKHVGFRMRKEDLSTEEASMSLPVSIARDFIVSCLYSAHNYRHLTRDMAREMTARFKDEELQAALGILYKQGWINAGNMRYPMNLSPAFKKRFNDTWLPLDVLEDAWKEANTLLESQDTGDVPVIRDYHAHGLSSGALLALLSAVATEKVTLSTEGVEVMRDADVEGLLDEFVQVKVLVPVSQSPKSNLQMHKKEGMRKTFSELLRESEMDEQMDTDLVEKESEDVCDSTCADVSQTLLSGDLSPIQKAAVEIITDSGMEGITQEHLQETLIKLGVSATEAENVGSLLDGLCAMGSVRCVRGCRGDIYFTKEKSQRFFFDSLEEGSSEMKCRSVPVRPWRDHKGNIHHDLLKKMQQQILSTVVERPGISEDDLVETLGYCSSHSIRDLCQLMTKQGLLKIETITISSAASLVPSYLLKQLSEVNTVIETCYFPNLPSCFAQMLPVMDHMDD